MVGEVFHGRTGRARPEERAKEQTQRLLHLGVGMEHHLPDVVVHQPNWQSDAQLTAASLREQAPLHPRPQQVQLRFG